MKSKVLILFAILAILICFAGCKGREDITGGVSEYIKVKQSEENSDMTSYNADDTAVLPENSKKTSAVPPESKDSKDMLSESQYNSSNSDINTSIITGDDQGPVVTVP